MKTTLTITADETFKHKLLLWANRFSYFCLLDHNQNQHYEVQYDFVLGVDQIDFFSIKADNFDAFIRWKSSKSNTVFGCFDYSLNHASFHLPDKTTDQRKGYFFEPRYLITLEGNQFTINRNYPEAMEILDAIQAESIEFYPSHAVDFKNHVTKEEYLQDIASIKQQIEQGCFYEINYCVEWYATDVKFHPVEVFMKLNRLAQAPFSACMKLDADYTLCASPERFLSKQGDRLKSQPIKGTIKRDRKNAQQDAALKEVLANSKKDQAENIMIVDLVRHDLTPYAKTGSIEVTELFAIYSFEQVHQMVSTIEATLKESSDGLKALKYAFPPGSMTGAPKREVMKYIEAYEKFPRGIFSGSIGYIDANQDFDFNVVIRSCFYNLETGYLSVKSGGAITYESNPEAEYEECLLKSEAIRKLF